MNKFLDQYQIEDKHKTTSLTYPAFVTSTEELFNIATCKCDLKTAQCSCGLIPDHLKGFMLDQHNERRMTIPEVQLEVEEQVPFSMSSIPSAADRTSDATYAPDYEEMDTTNPYNIGEEAGTSAQPEGPRERYSERYELFNFAMVCDRLGISDRKASALGTALLKDFGVKDSELIAEVSKRSISPNREGIMAVTLASREKQPKLDSKKDLRE